LQGSIHAFHPALRLAGVRTALVHARGRAS
jgi:hypothetical protein